MLVCRSFFFGRLMLHSTYTKEHPRIIKTLSDFHLGGTLVEYDKWLKLFSIGKRGLYIYIGKEMS